MGDRLWALRRPSRLKPFREGLTKKLFGNLVRWFLPFCCRASVERVMGSKVQVSFEGKIWQQKERLDWKASVQRSEMGEGLQKWQEMEQRRRPTQEKGEGGLSQGSWWSRLSKAVITILQVLVALVAPRVSRGVSHQAAAFRQQLLLGARQAAALRITAAWKHREQLHGGEQHRSVLRVSDVQLIQVLLLQQLKGVQVLVAVEQESGHVLLHERKHIHIDELEGAHFVVEQAHPRPHGRLTDDVDHIAALQNHKQPLNFAIYIRLQNIQASLGKKQKQETKDSSVLYL
ncbi:hypothetical protein EYF80_024107 [Liparis tanakae]|uniref:Uncharacterized protein n=1 Tax=Liparis tanakae TaxID=230148 RepID=A0A4Z2HL46_9TELE|nr:hypothetical protein EYF80_024107 [Liparis tanakae]